MIAALCVAIICAASLFAQHQEHKHQDSLKAGNGRLAEVCARIAALEQARSTQFDPVAFEDLRSKVEGIRLLQGMKGSRG